MQVNNIDHALTIASAALAKAAPEQWRTFMQALEAHGSAQKEKLINSPLPELPVHQGRAQTYSAILKILGNCLSNSENLTQKVK